MKRRTEWFTVVMVLALWYSVSKHYNLSVEFNDRNVNQVFNIHRLTQFATWGTRGNLAAQLIGASLIWQSLVGPILGIVLCRVTVPQGITRRGSLQIYPRFLKWQLNGSFSQVSEVKRNYFSIWWEYLPTWKIYSTCKWNAVICTAIDYEEKKTNACEAKNV